MAGLHFSPVVSDLLFAAWMLIVSFVTFGTFGAYRSLRRARTPWPLAVDSLPPISVLKPLKGLDEGARENLESFFLCRYPAFELVFSVASPEDPALPLVRELQAKYPRVPSRVFVGDVALGLNPKVNNLVRPFSAAAHDNVLISDSNTRVDADFLARMGAAFTPGVALLHCVVAGSAPRGVGGKLDWLALNTLYARGTFAVAATGHAVVTGKAMMFRRSELDRLGGLEALSMVIAEDYVAGQMFESAGLQVRLHTQAVPQHIGSLSFGGFWSRNLRWGRIRKGHAPLLFFAVEPLLGSVSSGLLGALAFRAHGLSPVQFFTLHMLIWGCNDLLLIRRIGERAGAWFVPFWLLRETLQLPLWLHTALGNRVTWRGQRFTLGAGERREARASV